MFAQDRMLTLNVGSGKIVLAEFKARSGQTPELLNYGMADLPQAPEGSSGGNGPALTAAIQKVMRERGIRPAPLSVALSGQLVFPRFVKLPAVTKDKLVQMVQYEVEQNVPFPLNEIVWNYQFIGSETGGEQSVMIVAARVESVREVTGAIVAAGLEPELVDVAPMALCNTLKFNHPDLTGCSIILDIGGRSTNLVFVEDDRIYSRCIPTAGNAITQELTRALSTDAATAELLKREKGFVSQGGVHVSEDEQVETISRVIRNVMTRLHAEISRSINFYRSQQGGSLPSRLILTGGSSVLPNLDQFFHEKLQIEVEYLNPFVNVGVGKKIDRQKAGTDAFVLGENVGLALRGSLQCPYEINLMPPEFLKAKTMKRRVPFLALAAVGVLMSMGIWGLYEQQMQKLYQRQQEQVADKLLQMQGEKKKLDAALKSRDAVKAKADEIRGVMASRSVWLKRIAAIKSCVADLFKQQEASARNGIWLVEISPFKTAEGQTGIHIAGRGWTDLLHQIERKSAEAGGVSKTAIEQLRDELKQKPFFGEGVPVVAQIKGVKMVNDGVKEGEPYLTDFTIEIAPGAAETGKRASAAATTGRRGRRR